MVRYSVLGRKSDSERKIPDISFHSFPYDDNLLQNWIKARSRSNWEPKKSSTICGRHFEQNKTCSFSWCCAIPGPNWTVISGFPEGQTISGRPDHNNIVVWTHPIDLHFITKGIQGWPKLVLQVSCLDTFGRSWIVGYSCCSLPVTPGHHTLHVPCWAPTATTIADRVRQLFLGGSHQLLQSDIINLGTDRFKLKTQTKGNLVLQLDIVLRNFSQFGVEYK